MEVTEFNFREAALPIIGRAKVTWSGDLDTCFLACFGMSSLLYVHVWDDFQASLPGGAALYHLLWGLLFLKAYGTEYTCLQW